MYYPIPLILDNTGPSNCNYMNASPPTKALDTIWYDIKRKSALQFLHLEFVYRISLLSVRYDIGTVYYSLTDLTLK